MPVGSIQLEETLFLRLSRNDPIELMKKIVAGGRDTIPPFSSPGSPSEVTIGPGEYYDHRVETFLKWIYFIRGDEGTDRYDGKWYLRAVVLGAYRTAEHDNESSEEPIALISNLSEVLFSDDAIDVGDEAK